MKKNTIPTISIESFRKIVVVTAVVLFLLFAVLVFEIYVPINPASHETIQYTVQKGVGDEEVAEDLENLGIIRSSLFFRFYTIVSFQDDSLQAGDYSLSPRMSTYQIVKKIAHGNVIKNSIVILEGWDEKDIETYLEMKNICTKDEFKALIKEDYSGKFLFLSDKPKNLTLEGYLFPDTYEISRNPDCKEVILAMLSNFDKKLTQEIQDQIKKQGKSIFDIIVMASIIEKEVHQEADKKMVSGVLWNRLGIDMPLQVDATINYITGKSDPSVLIKDTKIDSPYNTYMYRGLPLGPISNPGLSSIVAAVNPTESDYFYYLSNGITVFSKTFEEHKEARLKYLD